MIQRGETGGLEIVKRIRLLELVEEEAQTLTEVLGRAEKAPTGIMDVVLSPAAVRDRSRRVRWPPPGGRQDTRQGGSSGWRVLPLEGQPRDEGRERRGLRQRRPDDRALERLQPRRRRGRRLQEEAADRGRDSNGVPPEQEHVGAPRCQEQRLLEVGRFRQGAHNQDVQHVRRAGRLRDDRGADQGGEGRDIHQVVHRVEHRRQAPEPEVHGARGVPHKGRRGDVAREGTGAGDARRRRSGGA